MRAVVECIARAPIGPDHTFRDTSYQVLHPTMEKAHYEYIDANTIDLNTLDTLE